MSIVWAGHIIIEITPDALPLAKLRAIPSIVAPVLTGNYGYRFNLDNTAILIKGKFTNSRPTKTALVNFLASALGVTKSLLTSNLTIITFGDPTTLSLDERDDLRLRITESRSTVMDYISDPVRKDKWIPKKERPKT